MIREDRNVNELYPGYKKCLENAVRRIKKSSKIIKANKDWILKFKKHCEAKKLTDMRVVFHLTKLRYLAENTKKDFRKWDQEEVRKAVELINKKSGTAETRNGYIACLKCFIRFVLGFDSDDNLPSWIKWVKKETSPNKLKKEDLWTPEEFELFLNSIDDPKWKALFCILWECAPRVGEVRGIKLGKSIDEGNKMKFYIAGKMAKKQGDRPIFVIKFYSIVKNWVTIQSHKFNNNPDAYLFCDKNGKPVKQNSVLVKMKNVTKKCGIKKEAYPYIWRHTTGTEFYKKYTSVIARKLMGHGQKSRMEAVYCHLNEEDLSEALMGTNGKKKEETKEIIVCPRCHKTNGSEKCSNCGFSTEPIDKGEVELALKFLKAFRTLEQKYPDELRSVFEGIARKEGHEQ